MVPAVVVRLDMAVVRAVMTVVITGLGFAVPARDVGGGCTAAVIPSGVGCIPGRHEGESGKGRESISGSWDSSLEVGCLSLSSLANEVGVAIGRWC